MLQLVASAPWQCAHALPARAPSYGSAVSVDQATWSSPLFWSQLHSLIPRLDSAPSLERFPGFVNNLRTEAPGEIWPAVAARRASASVMVCSHDELSESAVKKSRNQPFS